MSKHIYNKRYSYNGKRLTIPEIIKASGFPEKAVYKYRKEHGTMAGFDKLKHRAHPFQYEYEGESLTARQIAERVGATYEAVRKHLKRHGSMEGFKTRKPSDWLQKCYNTLDMSNPLDRSIAAKGYRSIRQFCRANDINYPVVSCWHRGKPYYTNSLEFEMFHNGFTPTMRQLMDATGCLEHELFPNVFNEDFYRRLADTQVVKSQPRITYHPTAELRDSRRTLNRVLATLTDREQDIIKRYFNFNGEGEVNFSDIAKTYGLTRERIRMIFCRALYRLRRPTKMRMLSEICWWHDKYDTTTDNLKRALA